MKKSLLMKTFLLLFVLVVGSTCAWAGSIVFADLGLDNGVQYTDPFDGGDFTVTFGGGGNDGKYYDTGSGIRVYAEGTMTIAAKSGNIATIVITYAGSSYAPTSNDVVNVGTYDKSTHTWTGDAATVVFTRPTGSGHWRVQSITVTLGGTTTCATPTFSPAGGLYTSAQNVTISTTTTGASIYYTTDGSTPTASSTPYTGAIAVNATTTIKAIAVKEGNNNSTVASATYLILEHAGTEADPYSVADAREAIDAGIGVTDVYATGIVSQVDEVNTDNHWATYWISDDGTTTTQLEAYKGKNLDNTNFTSTEDIKVGDVVIIYGSLTKFSSTYEFSAGNYLTSKIRKVDSGLAAVEDEIQMEVTTERDATSLFTVTSDGAISYESSDATIAKVEGGKLKALKPGTATITISVAQTATYASGNVAIEVTVTTKPAVKPAGPADLSSYSLVTDASTLVAGDKIVLVNEKNGKVMAGQNTNNRAEDDVTISEHSIASLPSSAAVITLEGSSAGWNLKTEDGYLYAASSSSNYLKSRATVGDDNAKATISITDNNAVITFQGSNTRNKIKRNNSSSLFSCYSSAATTEDEYVQIYRVDKANTYDVAIGATGYKTLISAVSASLPAGLTAYKAVSAGEGKVQLTSVPSIKAGSAYVLKGTASTNYTLTVTDSPEDPTGNILEVSTETTGNGVYVLANGTSGPGFYKWAGGALGAGRAIVPASAVSSAHEFLEFSFDESDVTAIENVEVKKANGQYFNLAGQRVAQPTKGLYIVNGKKVIIK